MRFAVLLCLALALYTTETFGCKDQCCDLNCWEQCFADGSSGSYAAFYQQLYQVRFFTVYFCIITELKRGCLRNLMISY